MLRPSLLTLALACLAAPLAAQESAPAARPPAGPGAALTGAYPNLFRDYLGKTDAEVAAKLEAVWQHYFRGDPETQSLYYPVGEGMAYVPDINNNDVRSEGLSYGMMIAVQLDRQEEFNAIWKFAKTFMYHTEGPFRGYFAWHTDYTGKRLSQGPAPDGEEWFVMALFFASHRWGDGEGIFAYRQQAQEILRMMLHKDSQPDRGHATNMIVLAERQINFVPHGPGAQFTDPSYHVPAFYELWARWADDPADRAVLADLAPTSRQLFRRAAHPVTGLMPDYSHFDGRPYVHPRPGHEDFRYDAWRTLANPAMDWAWWRGDAWSIEQSNRVLTFLASHGDALPDRFKLDGTPVSTDLNTPGLLAMAAVAALAADRPIGEPWVRRLWDLPFPTGRQRYYDGLLTTLALLQVSGNFRIYGPVTP